MRISRRTLLELGAAGAGWALAGAGCKRSRPADEVIYGVPRSAMTGREADQALDLRVLSGRLPRDLEGHAFVVMAVPRGDGQHLFSGEGVTARLDFGQDPVRYRATVNRTPCYLADEATRGTADAFISRGLVRASPTLGFHAPLNTAFLTAGERLLLTIDAGRPYVLDPGEMTLFSPVGHRDDWRPAFRGAQNNAFPIYFSTAHPCWDAATGELFTVNSAYQSGDEPGFIDLLRFDPRLRMRRYQLRLPDGEIPVLRQLAHQIAFTEGHILIVDAAFVVEPGQAFAMQDAIAQTPFSVAYLIRRADLGDEGGAVEARRLVIPGEIIHFTADYDDSGGRITLHTAYIPGSDVSEWLRSGDPLLEGSPVDPALVGMFAGAVDRSEFARVVIDTERAAVVPEATMTLADDVFSWSLALLAHRPTFRGGHLTAERFEHMYWLGAGQTPNTTLKRIADLYADHPRRRVPVRGLPERGRPSTVSCLDPRKMRLVDGYAFPAGFYPATPQFLPRPHRTGDRDGYLMVTVTSDRPSDGSSGDEVWLFDAGALEAGPVCRLGAPVLDIPFTIHSAWLDRLASPPSEGRITIREDYAGFLADASPRARELFEASIFPSFEPAPKPT